MSNYYLELYTVAILCHLEFIGLVEFIVGLSVFMQFILFNHLDSPVTTESCS